MNDTIKRVKSKEKAVSKLSLTKVNVSSFNTLLIHCYYLAHTWLILRPYTKDTDVMARWRHYVRKDAWKGTDGRVGVASLLTIFCVLFSFPSAQEVQAQELRQGGVTGQAAIKPLAIGDTIPEELWNLPLQVVNHPEGKETITLNDYRDKKLIILDFWATWCAPCIKSLKELGVLQNEFLESIVIIPVTNETEKRWDKFQSNHNIHIPSVINEQYLQKFFPHRIVPHQVWIKQGQILSKSSSEYANVNNIQKILSGGVVKMLSYESTKNETLDSFVDPELRVGNGKLKFYSLLTNRLNGETTSIRKEKNIFAAINFPIISLYQLAFSNEIPFSERNLRTVNNIKDPKLRNLLDYSFNRTGDYKKDSLMIVLADSLKFTYILQANQEFLDKNSITKMRSDIATYFKDSFGIQAAVVNYPIKCLVLERNTEGPALKRESLNEKAAFYSYNSIEALVKALRYQYKDKGYYIINNIASEKRDWSC